MSLKLAEKLAEKLEKTTQWPMVQDLQVLKDILVWQWFREADSYHLKKAHPRGDGVGWPDDRNYLIDPLASRISEAFADLQFGEEPDFQPGVAADEERLMDLIRENAYPSELNQAAEIQVSEGEVWWRAKIDKDASDWPIIEYHSRATVVPLFQAKRLVAVAFISVIEDDKMAWRYVEIHSKGFVLNKLYEVPLSVKTTDSLWTEHYIPLNYHIGNPFGTEVPLTDHPDTEDLDPVWEHGLPMLAGRVINRRGRSPYVGVSQFARVKGLLFSLNEAATIGQHNMRLTARKRAVIDEGALRPVYDDAGQMTLEAPEFDSEESLFVRQGLDENLDSKTQPFTVLEYDFDAEAMVTWDTALETKILTRTRTAPSLVGRGQEGAETAPAVRARLLDSNLAANAKARFWDDSVRDQLGVLQLLDRLPITSGGFGRSWSDATKKPSMKRRSIIPEDPKDEADRHAVLMGAGLESQKTALREMHPEWDDPKIEDEIKEILKDRENGIQGTPNGTINRSNQVDPRTGEEQRVPGAGERGGGPRTE